MSIQKVCSNSTEDNYNNKIFATGMVANLACVPFLFAVDNKLSKISKNLNIEQIKQINNIADNLLKTEGLSKKGVKIYHVSGPTAKPTMIPDSIFSMIDKDFAVAKGKNAIYSSYTNSINVNRVKMPTAIFHELGHAYNYNNSKFWNIVQNMSNPLKLISQFMLLYSIVSKKSEPKEGENLNIFQKTNNFLINNSWKIAAGTSLPGIMEEVMASLRANNWANKNLPKLLAQKVKLSNLLGLVSYIAVTACIISSTYLMSKMKNKKEKVEEGKINT